MFHHQSEDRDSNILLHYPNTYKQWKQDNGFEDRKLSKRMYLDKDFFQFVVENYIENGTYKDEFAELIDLLIRKNITASEFIGYSEELHDDMYSLAMHKSVFNAPNSYDKERQSAFVYFTSAIRNSFYEVLKDHYKAKDTALRLLSSGADSIAYNIDPHHYTELERDIKNTLSLYEDKSMIIQRNEATEEFYEKIESTFETTQIKLLEDNDAPKFRRKYETYRCMIPVGESGVIVEYIDLPTTNEAHGTRPGYLKFRAHVARKSGYQYFAVFSDLWREMPDAIMFRIEYIKTLISMNHPINELGDQHGYDLGLSYIPRYDETMVQESNWYGLRKGTREEYDKIVKEVAEEMGVSDGEEFIRVVESRWSGDYVKRHVMIEQNVEAYMNWLDSEPGATRVYGCGRINV